MPSISLHMPGCGEQGVVIATRRYGVRVEFRGNPYHLWSADENTSMSRLHSALKRVNISQLHCSLVETVTPWHEEWPIVEAMFLEALNEEAL